MNGFCFRQGVIPAIAEVIEAFTEVGDKVLIHTPVYPPFTNVPTKLGRDVDNYVRLNRKE